MKYLWILPALLIVGCSSPTDTPEAPSIDWVGATTEKGSGGDYIITIYADLLGGDTSTLFTTFITVPGPGGDYEESFGYTLDYLPHGGIRASHQFDLPAYVGDSGDPFSYHAQWGDAVSQTHQGVLP